MKVAVLIALLSKCDPNADVVFFEEGEWGRNWHGDSVCDPESESDIGSVVDLETKVHLTS